MNGRECGFCLSSQKSTWSIVGFRHARKYVFLRFAVRGSKDSLYMFTFFVS